MPRPRFAPPVRCALALCVALALLPPVPAAFAVRAAIRVVTSLADNFVVGTLRSEIANAQPGDTITFALGLTGTITLANGAGQILIDKDVTIQGSGAANLTINGNNASRVFEVTTGKTVTISGVTVANGRAGSDDGGGIRNFGNLTVVGCTVRGNYSGSAGGGIYSSDVNLGGGIYSGGTLIVRNSTIADNAAPNGSSGGGITMTGSGTAHLEVTNSTIANNTARSLGGGISAVGGSVTITGSTIRDNTITGISSTLGGGGIGTYTTTTITGSTISGNRAFNSVGGGIAGFPNGGVTITNSTISGNTASLGGGIHGGVTITNSTISGNTATGSDGGGGMFGSGTITNSTFSGNVAMVGNGGGFRSDFRYGSANTITITNSTFSGNAASGGSGGGLYNSGWDTTVTRSTFANNGAANGGGLGNGGSSSTNAQLANVTFSGNPATVNGGGIHNADGVLTAYNITVASNTAPRGRGGGIYQLSGTMIFGNSLLALNEAREVGRDYNRGGGNVATIGNNFVSDPAGYAFPGDILGNSAPGLGPLADNGGPTQTRALLPGSPAVDAGRNDLCADLLVGNRDGRGLPRPPPGQCDIGAFEVQPFAAPTPPRPAGAPVGQPAPAPIAPRAAAPTPASPAPTPLTAPARR